MDYPTSMLTPNAPLMGTEPDFVKAHVMTPFKTPLLENSVKVNLKGVPWSCKKMSVG